MVHDKKIATQSFQDNIAYLDKRLGIDESFDLVKLDLEYAETNMVLYLVDGFAKDEILDQMMWVLANLKPQDLEGDKLRKLMRTYIPHVELDKTNDLNEVVDQVLAGPSALV